MSNFRIITLADENYFDYLKVFVNSLKINSPNIKISAYLVNLADKHTNEIQKINPNCSCYTESVLFKNPLQKRCYCTNRRGHLLKYLRDTTNDILMWLDADSVVRKPGLDNLFENLKSFDVCMRPKTPTDISKGFMGGLIGINNSRRAKMFTNVYRSILEREKYSYRRINSVAASMINDISELPRMSMSIWMANQNILCEVHRLLKNKVKFLFVQNKFLDTRFTDEGVVWTVKTSTRNNSKFSIESKNYEYK